MIKYIGMLVVTMITSMYFFPFEFTFLPGANTKMIMAGLGLVWFGINMARGAHEGGLNRNLFNLSIWAMGVSLVAYMAITLNNTNDYVYATYIVSMWVWLGGAYTATQLMKALHGRLDITLVGNYLIAVCVSQCIIAFAMSEYQPLKDFVDGFLGSTGFMGKVESRMYGIGASLDVAGMRFAAVLVIISFLCANLDSANWQRRLGYIISFFIIVIIGNMIGRTTTVGAGMAILCWIYTLVFGDDKQKAEVKQMLLTMSSVLLCLLPVIIYFYNTSTSVHDNIRFGFEGFFSLVEKGHWETHSNNILKNMYDLPETTKTWLIGDGYFDDAIAVDPYYLGYAWKGFYHGTDVGYLRFIFYGGVFFMLMFVIYMLRVALVCMGRFKDYRLLFFALLILNYLVWLKVSSDLFPVFAIFLCITANDMDQADALRRQQEGQLEHERLSVKANI